MNYSYIKDFHKSRDKKLSESEGKMNLVKKVDDLVCDLKKCAHDIQYFYGNKTIAAYFKHNDYRGYVKGIESEYVKIVIDLALKHDCMYRISINHSQTAVEFEFIGENK